MKIVGLIFSIIGGIRIYEDRSFMHQNTIPVQSHIFYYGLTATILGLALLLFGFCRTS